MESPGTQLLLYRSVFRDRPATILFDYPSQCQKPSRVNARCISAQATAYFRLCKNSNVYNAVVNSFKHAGLTQVTSKQFAIYYGGLPKQKRVSRLRPHQKYNHFPGSWQLGRKDHLYRNVARMKRRFGGDYELCPVTYILPDELNRFVLDQPAFPLWIFKPASGSCGKGIKLLHNKVPSRPGVVSRYIANPHTLHGRKYDLRLYVLVTSYDPLKIYLYEEGLVRLATEPYATEKNTLKNKCVHLTNYSVNKRSPHYVKNHEENEASSCKWSLGALRQAYADAGIDFATVFQRVKDLIIKTCISVEPGIVNHTLRLCKDKSACFELYGFDVLIDDQLRPWLLEVNVSPSLSSSSPFDKRVKTSLMCDVFTLVGVVPGEFRAPVQLSSRRLHRNTAQLKAYSSLFDLELTEDDLNVILTAHEERSRLGQFEPIFPLRSNVEQYRGYFDTDRFANILLWRSLLEPEFVRQFLDSGS